MMLEKQSSERLGYNIEPEKIKEEGPDRNNVN
jgi:hypothetical protein